MIASASLLSCHFPQNRIKSFLPGSSSKVDLWLIDILHTSSSSLHGMLSPKSKFWISDRARAVSWKRPSRQCQSIRISYQILRAKRIALPTFFVFDDESEVINEPILLFGTVCKWSQLIAQSFSIPSVLERNTSDGMSRIVLVTGAIVTSPRYSKTEFLVRIKIGLFLSGWVNLYHRISPCFIRLPSLAHFPK